MQLHCVSRWTIYITVIYYLLTRFLDLQSVRRSVFDEHGTSWKGNTRVSLPQRRRSCWWPCFQNRKNQHQKRITSDWVTLNASTIAGGTKYVEYVQSWCSIHQSHVQRMYFLNPLNAELNPIRHLLASVGAHHIVHVSRIRVKLSAATQFIR